MSSSDDVVLFDTLTTASGHVFGRATLNVPASLNALSLPMIDRLAPQFAAWQADPQVAGIVLDAAGDKAFCAGGDIVDMYRDRLATPEGQVPQGSATFFEREYRLDHAIHTSRKPVLCWAHGIVMGGGMGLMVGASHRVLSPRSRLAMPEVAIGLYPDVGGSWFLPRMPDGLGLFLGLSGVHFNAADALQVGLGDVVLPHEAKAAVLQAIGHERWSGVRTEDDARLSALLRAHAAAEMPASSLAAHRGAIARVTQGDDLTRVAQAMSDLARHDEAFLAQAGQLFVKGCPSSIALAWAMHGRGAALGSLAEVFRLEWQASVGCCVHRDFAEGVRALLVDKDRQPKWQPATLAEVTPEFIEGFLAPRFEGAHPLADLR